MRAIDEVELINELYGLFECTALPNDRYTMGRNSMITTIIDYLDKAVITDVQPVVYCKDCRHCDKIDNEYYVCGMFSDECKCVTTEDNRYCWWGETRIDNQ